MIKLIASDLDGTLLQNGARTLSDTVIEQIKQLKKMGILFVAASGRQYTNLRRLFEPVCDEIAYVCENGAMVVYKGKILHKDVFERELAEEILHSILKKERAELVVSGEKTVYLQPKTEDFRKYMIDFVKNNTTILPDIFQVPEDMIKISVYEENSAEFIAPFWKKAFGDRATVVISGLSWLDMMPMSADKGNGIRVLKRHLLITEEECAAFGDNFNDLEMLQEVAYGFAVGSAKKEVRQTAGRTAQTVEAVLEKIIEQGGNWYE